MRAALFFIAHAAASRLPNQAVAPLYDVPVVDPAGKLIVHEQGLRGFFLLDTGAGSQATLHGEPRVPEGTCSRQARVQTHERAIRDSGGSLSPGELGGGEGDTHDESPVGAARQWVSGSVIRALEHDSEKDQAPYQLVGRHSGLPACCGDAAGRGRPPPDRVELIGAGSLGYGTGPSFG